MHKFNLLAFDIGGTNVRAVVVDESGKVLRRTVVSSTQLATEIDTIGFISKIILNESSHINSELDGVVIGVPGIMDRKRRSILKAPLVSSLEIDNFADHLQARCGIRVILDHDATLQTRGEAFFGAAAGKNLVLGVYFGTGVGAAFIDSGRLMGGPYRMQLGHVPLRGDGRHGTGGATDCVEAYASGVVLQSLASKYNVPIADIFISGDRALQRELDTFLSDQAITVAMAITLTDPEVVVLGGGLMDMNAYPFDELVNRIQEKLSPVLRLSQRCIRRAELGQNGATWGAISLFQDESERGC
jgi:allose kinase